MDRVVESISEYARAMRSRPVPFEGLKLRVLDALGCAIGGSSAPPVEVAREVVHRLETDGPCTVLLDGKASADRATFLNSFMLRYLDYNDTYMGRDAAHPSDLIPAALAVAEAERRSGEDALRAISAAYGVLCTFCDVAVTWDRGWDLSFTAVAAAVAAGMLLDLSDAQMANAVSLSIVPKIALRQSRSGALSHWKGAASADATAHAVRAAYLAAGGMTGPDAPFEGPFGVMAQVTGPFEFAIDYARDRPSETDVKLFPFGYFAHGPAELALELRGEIGTGEVSRVEIATHRVAIEAYADGPDKWAPATHETADHSIPYLFALAFAYGRADYDDIDRGMQDPKVLELVQKVSVVEVPSMTERYPGVCPARVRIWTRDRVQDGELEAPLGHHTRAVPAGRISAKLHANADPIVGADRTSRFERRILALDTLPDMAGFLEV